MCSRSSVPCTLKDGQKAIITIKSSGRRRNRYHIATRIYASNSNSAMCFQESFPDNCAQSVVPALPGVVRQLREGLNHRQIKTIPERISPLGN